MEETTDVTPHGGPDPGPQLSAPVQLAALASAAAMLVSAIAWAVFYTTADGVGRGGSVAAGWTGVVAAIAGIGLSAVAAFAGARELGTGRWRALGRALRTVWGLFWSLP